jgi:hypothetical protein
MHTIVEFLGIIYHPAFYLKTVFQRLVSVSILRQNPTQLGPIDGASLGFIFC